MNDSEIPAFTTAILRVCKQAAKNGRYEKPKAPGCLNLDWCPLMAYYDLNRRPVFFIEKYNLISSFMAGYDMRAPHMDNDYRFYILGKTFRDIAIATGFKS